MKTILEMIAKLERGHKNLKLTEDKIIDKVVKLLGKNEYLLKQEKIVENCDEKECYVIANDISGVDYTIPFDLKKLELDIPKEYLEQAVDRYFYQTGIHYDIREGQLSVSSSDEIFISHDDKIIFPDTDSKNNFLPFVDDFHAWLLIEEWMIENGNFPGVWNSDYYGGVSYKKFDQNYSELFPSDSKAKLKKIQKYLSLYKCKQETDNGYTWSLSDLNNEIFDLLPTDIKDINYENNLTIYNVKEISFESLIIELEIGEHDLTGTSAKLVNAQYGIYEYTIRLESNALLWILSSDKLGDGHEFSI